MLVELTIRNFTSLKDVTVKLGKLNVLIGPNASGKSNLIRALNFLKLLFVSDVPNAIRGLGYQNIVDLIYGQDPELNIQFIVTAIINGHEYVYDISLNGKGIIEDEALIIDGKDFLNRKDKGGGEYLLKEGAIRKAEVQFGVLLLRNACSYEDSHPLIKAFCNFISRWSFYSFDPEAIRGYAPVTYSTSLSRNGNNLSQVLHTLLTTNRRVFEKIEVYLKSLVPEVEELITPISGSPQGPQVHLAVKERCFEKPFSFRQVSDGTLRLLAFITALNLDSTLITFEEPENRIHPRLLETLIDLMRKSDKQNIITTHSPCLVDYVKPEELLLVVKVKGETKVKRLVDTEDIERVRKFLEEGGTLGEAWYSGVIEDVGHEESVDNNRRA